MIETLTLNRAKKETEKQLEFMNDFGAVFTNYFFVYNNTFKLTIPFDDTRNVIIRKKRKTKKNIIVLCIGVFTSICIYYCNLSFIAKICFTSLVLVLFILSIQLKEYKYLFIIIKQNDCIQFEVQKNLKDEAKKIQRVVKEKLKTII